MLRQLRDLVDLMRALVQRIEGLQEDLEALRGDQDYDHLELERLRGRVTGSERRRKSLDVAPGSTETDAPSPKGSPEWFKQQRDRYGLSRNAR